jgi:hypothetical protein
VFFRLCDLLLDELQGAGVIADLPRQEANYPRVRGPGRHRGRVVGCVLAQLDKSARALHPKNILPVTD